jgi:hypothetical protein
MNAQFRKTLAIVGLIFVFTLGGFSLGLAQTYVTGPIQRLTLHEGFSHGLSRSASLAWRMALDCESCDPPAPLTESPAAGWPVSTPLVGCSDSFTYAGPYAPKISRHMLDSVLLI